MIKPNPNKLRDDFCIEYGITLNDIRYTHFELDGEKQKTTDLFKTDNKGNLRIYYPTLDGKLAHHSKQGVEKISYRTRLLNPYLNKQGKQVKYNMEGKNRIFFPPQMIKAFKDRTVIETLFVTEGEKKAHVACKNGIDCVSISGIWNFCEVPENKDVLQGPLMPELKEFLKACGVKRVVLLHDSDALDPTLNENTAATQRPTDFYMATKRFAELIFQEGVQFFYSYINPKLSEEKQGLDDLIKNYEDPTQRILLALYASVEHNTHNTYFCTTQIQFIQNSFIKAIFKLTDPEDFYKYHKAKFTGRKEFIFEHRTFEIDQVAGKITEIKKTGRESVWIDKGCYFGYDMRSNVKQITNFTMSVLFLLKSNKDPKRIMEFKNILGQQFVKELNMDDLVSVSAFRKRLIGDGSFIFKGDMYELLNLQEILFKEEKNAIELTSLGWQKHHKFFAFSNGITEGGNWFPINEYGIVSRHSEMFYLPAFSNLFTDADEAFENERKFRHMESPATFEAWADLFYRSYKNNGAICIAFYMAALFRDIIFNEFKEFPLLNVFGQKGSGKSTVVKSLLSLFGEPPTAISLENGSSTKKGIYRRFAQYRNAFIWLDEYKNTIHPDLIGICKNLYDGIGYERAQTSNDNRTISNPVLSSTILSGQDMPTIDPALFTRVILLMFKNNVFTEEDRLAYTQLKAMEKKGLTGITISLLTNRELVAANFLKEFKKYFERFSVEFKYDDIPDRLLKNAAILMAPAAVIHEMGNVKLPFTIAELFAKFVDILKKHKDLLNDNQEIQVFWDTVEVLSDEKVLIEDRDYRFVGDHVAIRFKRAYAAYTEKMRKMQGKNGLDSMTLTNYLKDSAAYVETKDFRFDGPPTSAFVFKYKELGINIKQKLDANDKLAAELENSGVAPGADDENKDLPF